MWPVSLRVKGFFAVAVVIGAINSLVACGSDYAIPTGTCDSPCDGGSSDVTLVDAQTDGGAPPCEASACDGGSTDSRPRDSTVADGSDSGSDGAADADSSSGGDAGCTLTTADAGPGGALNWAKNFGVTGYTTAMSVGIDPSNGDVVVAGSFDGTVNFGGGLALSHGDAGTGYDTFIARFDKNGAYRWSKTFGNGIATSAHGVAVDGSGNVVMAGNFQGTLNFGGGALTAVGTFDLFVVQFDSAGNHRWSKSFGVVGQGQNLDTAAVDLARNVVIAGNARGGVNFGGGPKTGYYIAKFDSNGAHSWSNGFAATSTASVPTLAVDRSGSMILAGSFTTTVDFGGGTLTSAGATDAFVAKFNSSGAYQWAKQYGDNGGQDVQGVGVDPCGNVFVTGNFGGAINFGSGALTATDSSKAYSFLAKIDPSGNGVWGKEFVGSSATNTNLSMSAASVAVDGAGRPTITAGFGGAPGYRTSVDFGGGVLTSIDDISMAVAGFDAAGNYRWAYMGGSPSTADSFPAGNTSVAASGTTVVVGGGFGKCASTCATSPPGTTLVVAGTTLTAVSAQDLFLASFVP